MRFVCVERGRERGGVGGCCACGCSWLKQSSSVRPGCRNKQLAFGEFSPKTEEARAQREPSQELEAKKAPSLSKEGTGN